MASHVSNDEKVAAVAGREEIVEITRHLSRRQVHRSDIEARYGWRFFQKLGLNGAGQLQFTRFLLVADAQIFLPLAAGDPRSWSPCRRCT